MIWNSLTVEPTNLSIFFVRGGIVGDFKVVEVDHLFQLVVVAPPLAQNHSDVKEEYVPASPRGKNTHKHAKHVSFAQAKAARLLHITDGRSSPVLLGPFVNCRDPHLPIAFGASVVP